jgi:hypothetical protein
LRASSTNRKQKKQFRNQLTKKYAPTMSSSQRLFLYIRPNQLTAHKALKHAPSTPRGADRGTPVSDGEGSGLGKGGEGKLGATLG